MPTNKRYRKKRWGDFTVPGYNYLGPGNPDDHYPPTNEDDAIAQQHDKAYGDYIHQGLNPYTNFNQADQDFLDQVGHSYPGKVAWAIFQLKKGLSHARIIGTITSKYSSK